MGPGWPSTVAGTLLFLDLWLNAGRRAVKAAVGLDHSCVIVRGGKLVCFGDNSNGELGLGFTGIGDFGRVSLSKMPYVDFGVPGGGFVLDVSCGVDFTCAVVVSEGNKRSIHCFGDNQYFQLGRRTDSIQEEVNPTRPSTALNFGGRHPESVACDRTTACAVLTGGGVTCWGSSVSTEPAMILGRGQSLVAGEWTDITRSALVQLGRRRPAILQLLAPPPSTVASG